MERIKPVDAKVNIKPVFFQLIHHAAYEGPCRVGKRENLEPQAEIVGGKEQFGSFVESLKKNLSADAQLMEPIYVEWKDDFVIPESEIKRLEPDVHDADMIFIATAGLPQYPAITIGQRYKKPVGMMGWVAAIDAIAYLRSRGLEGYTFLDFDHLNRFISLLRVRKAVRSMKLLVALEGNIITTGVVSNIYDLEGLKSRYGADYTCVTADELISQMDNLPDNGLDQAEELTNRLVENAQNVHMSRDDVLRSVRFYVATRRVMEKYESNAFVIPCFEICARTILEDRRITFCLTHTLLKDAGIPSACEGDINVMMSMALLMYISKKSAYMGNSYAIDREQNVLAIHHDVPGLKMKGLGSSDLPYEIRNFTVGGWGATVRYDFSRDTGEPVTMARFNPAATKLLVVKGEIAGGGGFGNIGCALSAHVKVRDIVDLFHKEMDFGHHLALVYGDYVDDMKELGKLMGFEVVEA
jgi:L-fucose isomerase-like protein